MNKQLYRSKRNRLIAGVAGGIAEYFDIDPVIVRAVFIISALGWGFSILVYIVLWIIVPDEKKFYGFQVSDEKESEKNYENFSYEIESKIRKSNERKLIWGIVLITLGLIFFLNNITQFAIFAHLWPLVLIALGAYILFKNRNINETQEVK